MRRLYLLLLTLVVTLSAMANPIDRQQARQQAKNFLQAKGVALGGEAARAVGRTSSTSKQPLYVFNASNNRGFVIVAGDDRVEPIVGYTTRGSFDDGDLPENFRAWLEGYAAQLKAIEANEAKPAKNMAARIQKPAIEPLIRTHWDQGNPYSLHTPTYKSDNGDYYHYVTGCVATALAQVMYYYQWPASCPTIPAYTTSTNKIPMPELPATTFKWDKMKLEYNYDDSGEAADAVAELLLYVGQANSMNYDKGGSGTYIHEDIMASTFGYSHNMCSVWRNDYTSAEWEDMIYQELAANRPVLYDGDSDNGGHQFICDGYDGNGLYHFNWGWGGSYDGYFVISLANIPEKDLAQRVGFAIMQCAIIGFQPGSSDEPEIPHIRTYSSRMKPATYSRSSGDADFEDVSLNGWLNSTYNCVPTTTYPIEAGWALWQDGQLLEILSTKDYTIDNREEEYGNYFVSETVSFGAGLADGSYRLVVVWRPQGSSEWTIASTKDALYAEISGNSLSVRDINENPVTYTVNAVEYEGEMTQGSDNKIIVNLTNTCDVTQQMVCYWMKEGDTWKLMGRNIGSVEPGQTGEVSLFFTPESPGTYDVRITSDTNDENVIWTSTVTIHELIEITVDRITYALNTHTKEAQVKGTTITDSEEYVSLEILSTVNDGGTDYIVNKIGKNAFSNKKFKSISLPATLKAIDEYAFYYVRNLNEIVIPEGVETIGNNAFYGCNLTKVTLPSTLKTIGSRAFYNNRNLTTIVSAMTDPISITADVFTNDVWKGETYTECFSSATLCIPIGTKAAYQNAEVWKDFSHIYEGELKETTIAGITYRYVTGEGIATVMSGDKEALDDQDLIIHATVTVGGKDYQVKSIAASAFGQVQVKSLTIEPGIEEIGDYAFFNLYRIKTITIPESVKTIGNYVFAYCYNVTEVRLPSTLQSIGDYAFFDLNLNSVISAMQEPCLINKNVFLITRWENEQQFESFTTAALYVPAGTKTTYQQTEGWKEFSPIHEGELKETTIAGITYKYVTGEGIATIMSGDKEALDDQDLIIPAKITVDGKDYLVKSIAASAFDEVQVKSLTIEPGIEEIGDYAFWDLYRLKKITIPEGVKTIGRSAFAYCFYVTEVRLPSTLQSIDDYAFASINYLNSVISAMPEPCPVNKNVFSTTRWENEQSIEIFTTATLNIPKGTKQAYLGAEGWQEFGDNIAETLPAPGEEEEIDGDANGDGEVNVADIDFVIERIGTSYETNKAADVNHDDLINVADVDYIIERIN